MKMAKYKITNNANLPKRVDDTRIAAGETEEVEMLVKEAEEITDKYLDFERVDDMLEESSESEEEEESEDSKPEDQNSDSHGGEN